MGVRGGNTSSRQWDWVSEMEKKKTEKRRREPTPKFKVGDWVSFLYGARPCVAQIIEDRGMLGAGGRRMYRVYLEQQWADPMELEVREDEMQPAAAPTA